MPTSYSSTDQEDPEQPPDNRHPNNDSSNSRNGENWQSASETDSLLAKNNGDNSGDDRTEDENHESSGGLLGTIVEGVEYIAEHAQEAATEFKEAIAEQAHLVVEEMEHMAENASEIAHDIGVAIAEEAIDVKDHLVDNLVDKDGGESIMFEMGLVRNLSMLPQDIEEIAHSHPTHDDNDEEDTILPEGAGVFDCCPQSIKSCCRLQVETEKTKLVDEAGHVSIIEKTKGGTPFHAYITLIGAVVCLSSIGPSLDMQGGVASSMKIYWRMTGTYVVLFPLALKSAMHTGFPTLTNVQLCTFGLAAFCYAVMCVAFVLALEYTSVGNAVIFANSQSLLLLVGKMVVGQAVSYMEGSGALVAFSGAILCATDSSASTGNTFSTDTSASVVWAGVGDLLALLSAIGVSNLAC